MGSTTTKRRSMGIVGRLVATLALGSGAAFASAAPAAAADLGAGLDCPVGAGGYALNLPFVYQPHYSQFYISVDGRPWATTNWFWSSAYQNYEYTSSGWQVAGVTRSISTGHDNVVYAWEYRYYSNGATEWVNLGSCRTSSFDFGGIVFF